MKVALLEDLVADMYARLYELNIHQFVEQVNEENSNKMKVDHILMNMDGAADTSTPPTSAPTSEAPAPRGRTKGIARRDIQKRAEAIVARRLTSRALPAKPAAEPTTQPSATSVPSTAPAVPAPETSRDPVEESISAQQSDIPGSVHDSADDESELSEIDDEKLSRLTAERRSLFPNLHEGDSGDPGSELSGQFSFDGGDAEAEGEGEGEGQGEAKGEGDDERNEEEGEEEGDGDGGEEPEVEGDEEKEEGADLGGDEDETMGEAGDEEGEGEGEEAEVEGEGDVDGADEEGAGEPGIAEEAEGEGDTKDSQAVDTGTSDV